MKASRAFHKYKAKWNAWPIVREPCGTSSPGGGYHQHIGLGHGARQVASALGREPE